MSRPSGPARTVVIALFTMVETASLGLWLAFVADAPTVSTAAAIGLGILLVGLVVEHVLTDLAVNGGPLSVPSLAVVAFSASETVLWAVWLVVAEQVGGLVGLLVAGVLLLVLLVSQHTVEDNVLRGRGLLADIVDIRTAGFSAVEAVGATLWLAVAFELVDLGSVLGGGFGADLAGLAVLAVALFVEHSMGVQFSSRS